MKKSQGPCRIEAKAKFGSIIAGTTNPQDTIPAFCAELRRIRGSVPGDLWRRAWSAMQHSSIMDEEGIDIANELIDELSALAPDYGYFGAHPGDSADFGFWLPEAFQESIREDGLLEVTDTSEVPEGYTGGVLLVNDHGNATLFACDKGHLSEVWSVV